MMMRSYWIVVLLSALVVTACGSEPWQGGLEGAPAAYLNLSADRDVTERLQIHLSSETGVSEGPHAFIPGIIAVLIGFDKTTEVWGIRMEFADGAPDSTREIVRDRALAEGLDEPIWLGLDDEWPDCAGEPNCQMVREARGE